VHVRRWNDRPATPAQYDLTRVRAIGEWGHASRFVGSRWEEVGLDRLRAGVAGRSPIGLLPICADEALQGALASTGSKNPDAVVAFAGDQTVVLQPADLKWSLDVASYRQISAPVLAGLLAQVPALGDAVRKLLPEEQRDWAWSPADGFFFCPRSIANERFVTSPENRKQEYPIEPKEVLFEAVEPYAFFEPLPGWLTARELARLDGSSRGLQYLDNADRYYHLGAGVAGALVALSHSIFDDEPAIEPAGEVDRFRAFLKTLSPASTGLVIDRLGAVVRQRQALQRALRDLGRAEFGFKDFAGELIQAGLAAEGDSESVLRRTWGETYRALTEAQDQEIREAGRRLRARLTSDAEALDALARQRDSFVRRQRIRLKAALESRILESPE
jgi:hypothetical protein